MFPAPQLRSPREGICRCQNFADDYVLAPIIAEFADAVEAYVQSATSEDVTLAWTGFHSPVCWAPLEVSSESVVQSFSEALGAVALDAIASRHER